jgi:hypothetical protein
MNYWKRSQRDPLNWQLNPIQDDDGKDVLFEIADPESLLQGNHLEGIKDILSHQLKQKGLAYRLVFNLLEEGHTLGEIVEAMGKPKETIRKLVREIVEEARLLVNMVRPEVKPEPTTLRTRFEARITKVESCWRWTGTFCGAYGVLDVKDATGKRRRLRACKLALRLFRGDQIADTHKPKHTCGNRWCVNPAHLGCDPAPREQVVEEPPPVRHLDQAAIRELADRRSGGESEERLAAEYGVSVGTLRRILEMTPWRKVA